MIHSGKRGGNELIPPVFDGGDICKYQEAVGCLTEENNAQNNGSDPKTAVGLFLLLLLFLTAFALSMVFIAIVFSIRIVDIDV